MVNRILILVVMWMVFSFMVSNFRKFNLFEENNTFKLRSDELKVSMKQLLACNTVAYFILLVCLAVKLIRG